MSLDGLLRVELGSILPGSDFLSAAGADPLAGRRCIAEAVAQGRPASAAAMMRAAHPTPSHLQEARLGCGLPMVLPVAQAGDRVTSIGELRPAPHRVMGYRQSGSVDEPGRPPAVLGSREAWGDTEEARAALGEVLAHDPSWWPFYTTTERFGLRRAGPYELLTRDNDCQPLGRKTVLGGGQAAEFTYWGTLSPAWPPQFDSLSVKLIVHRQDRTDQLAVTVQRVESRSCSTAKAACSSQNPYRIVKLAWGAEGGLTLAHVAAGWHGYVPLPGPDDDGTIKAQKRARLEGALAEFFPAPIVRALAARRLDYGATAEAIVEAGKGLEDPDVPSWGALRWSTV